MLTWMTQVNETMIIMAVANANFSINHTSPDPPTPADFSEPHHAPLCLH